MFDHGVSELLALADREGVKVCFCGVCKHAPTYGHCYLCICENHILAPTLTGEASKLLEVVNYLKRQLGS